MEAMGTEAESSGKSEEEKIEESRNTKRFVSFHEKKKFYCFVNYFPSTDFEPRCRL